MGCSLSSQSLFFVLLSERLFELGETFLQVPSSKRPFCTVCLQADRLRAVASQLFWSILKAFVVCLWDVFPEQVLRRGGLWGSVGRPCARRDRASAYVSV